ncbi:hypothetical protein ESCO_005702 [Escovopsis weberi]|uniref:non-specific serine/threonine protein kinase n=1 Tax=Escovopsis weberi TaxID=150374 RepID=A0A0M8N4W0_ESCWE|nr:hypothetical protein ESCO_005702 [Escovopsis weberi]
MPHPPIGSFPKAKRPNMAEEVSLLFNEELRHFSHNIAKDCDKAFKTSLIDVHSISGSLHDWGDVDSALHQQDTDENSSSDVTSEGYKRRHFSFSFWKSNRERDSKMMIDNARGGAGEDRDVTVRAKAQKQGLRNSASAGSRNIEVKQNWFARLFRVKPATGYICLTLSRKRARQEVAILLKEWRKYGMRGVSVDKERNIVFARIGAKNHLNLKKVSFAAEIVAVIEHGKKQPLSIVRFTQERGAASSFHKVVDTMRIVFASRNLLVAERNKQKMMIKTLNS